jgi:glycine cleavage system H protein
MTPKDLRYSKEHEWVRKEDEEHVRIGITDYAQRELGDIVFVELPAVGTSLDYMQPFATLEAVKTMTDVNSPVTGEVLEVNESLVNDPSLVNKLPYEGGWFIRARMSNPSELDTLMTAEGYEEFVKGLGGEA